MASRTGSIRRCRKRVERRIKEAVPQSRSLEKRGEKLASGMYAKGQNQFGRDEQTVWGKNSKKTTMHGWIMWD
jgi:hypothetical protein